MGACVMGKGEHKVDYLCSFRRQRLLNILRQLNWEQEVGAGMNGEQANVCRYEVGAGVQ